MRVLYEFIEVRLNDNVDPCSMVNLNGAMMEHAIKSD